MALGAGPRAIRRLVLGQGARLAGLGLTLGVLAALGATRLMTDFLFGVSATDTLTYLGVAGLLAAVTLLACYLPARRATRVDPMTALRWE
jgi:ABC-type antimicrobial peptide transport system permease subunit